MTMAQGAPVITRLMGGLGNQMFQYATGLALSRRLGAPLLIDRTFLDARPAGMNWTARELELDVFDLRIEAADPSLIRDLRRQRRPVAIRRQTWFRERDKRYDPQFARLRAPVLLDGYWQSELYFGNIASELREQVFHQAGEPSQENLELLHLGASMSTASVHVRCGDYLMDPAAAAYHGRPTRAYYEAAAAELFEKHGVRHFFIFSDEPAKARTFVHLPGGMTFVSHNTGRAAHWDLWLMRQCRYHIIANSSFSWWGAWLNPSPTKVVIAPNTWFAGDPRPHDIVPSTWLRR